MPISFSNSCRSLSQRFVKFWRALICLKKYHVLTRHIAIETSSMCQLRCMECPQRRNDMGIVGRGCLTAQNFKAFLDSYPEFNRISISNWGEIFLNPHLKDILAYAHQKNVKLHASNGVNLNTADDDVLEAIVKYRLHTMNVSLDGASNETYQQYRVGGNFDTVIENIKKINDYKQKEKTNFPQMSWQFVVFGFNEHELPIAREMAQNLNMQFTPIAAWHDDYSPLKNPQWVKSQVGFTTREEFDQLYASLPYQYSCLQFWMNPQINWDGKLLGCCINRWKDFGNVFEKGLKECITSPQYQYTKKVLLGQESPHKEIPCYYCHVYQSMKRPDSPKITQRLLAYILLRQLKKALINNTD